MKTLFDDYLSENLEYGTKSKIPLSKDSSVETLISKALKLDLVSTAEKSQHYIEFKPKVDLLTKMSLDCVLDFVNSCNTKRDTRSNKREVLICSVPSPGNMISSTDMRVLFTTRYLISIRKYLEVQLVVQPRTIPDIHSAYLVLAAEKYGFNQREVVNLEKDLFLLAERGRQDPEINELLAADKLKELNIAGEVNSTWRNILTLWLSEISCNVGIDLLSENNGLEQFSIAVFPDKFFQHFQNMKACNPSLKLLRVGSSDQVLESPSEVFLSTEQYLALKSNLDCNIQEEVSKTKRLAQSMYVFQLFGSKLNSKLYYAGAQLKNQNASAGIAVQYTYARCCGIQRFIDSDLTWCSKVQTCPDLSPLLGAPKTFRLVEYVSIFPIVFQESLCNPCKLTAYICKLGKMTSSQYYHLRIKGESIANQKARWAVLYCVKKILELVFEVFSVPPVDKI